MPIPRRNHAENRWAVTFLGPGKPAAAGSRCRLAELVKNRLVLPILLSTMATTTQTRWLRVQQAADLLGVSASTVRRWADSGKLVGRQSPSGQRRFALDDLERIVSGADGHPGPQVGPGSDEQRYRLLFETSLELASSLELDEVLQSAARRLSAALQIHDCDVYRLESDGRLVCIASTIDGACDATWVGQEISLEEWPCKHLAVETGRTVTVSSLDDPRLTETERENMRGCGHTAASRCR